MSESFATLFEESLEKDISVRTGDTIDATILEIEGDRVIVTAGLKSEGSIPKEQFDGESIQLGDQISVVLEDIDDGFGNTRLSREKARRNEAWKDLEIAFGSGEIIKGLIRDKVKGGFTVELNTIRAFLPGSLVDVRPTKESAIMEEKELDFKVIKLDPKRNNVVVSRRAVLEAENSAEREALLSTLEEGQEVKGIIKNLTDYGAFVDLGGVDGLLHITDMSWRRIRHPNEVVNVGDEITVKVLKFEKEKNRVSLGMKQLGEDPWLSIKERYPQGTIANARVTNLTDYGCFAELEEGVEGLVHVSEMDWTNKNINPKAIVQIDSEIQVMVLDIDEERRRISLGIKQCMPNPWEEFDKKHDKNDKVTGAIKSITDFGLFIGLEGGIDGLVHLSDLSWSLAGEEAIRNYKKGEEVEAVILSINADLERISLGIKQLDDDPYNSFIRLHDKGSLVQGKILEVEAKEASLELAEDVIAILKASEISNRRIDDARNELQVGEEVEVKITGTNPKTRQIFVSIKAREQAEERQAMQSHKEAQEAAVKSTTIGDLIKQKMEDKSSDSE